MIDIDAFKDFYAETYGSKKNQILSKADEGRLATIVNWLQEANTVLETTVEVYGARVAIDAVEAYGLEITVDANGNAVHVSSKHGFHVDCA